MNPSDQNKRGHRTSGSEKKFGAKAGGIAIAKAGWSE